MRYNAFNPNAMRGFSTSVNAVIIADKIINANWIDSLGRQVSKPLNVNGFHNINANIVNTFSLKKQQASITTNTVFVLNQELSYINGLKGNINNFNIIHGINFNYMYKELFDFSTGASVNYSKVQYSMQNDNTTNYLNSAFFFNCNVNILQGFAIGGSLDYMLNTGRVPGYNLDATILNLFISKSLFSRKQGLIKVQGFDLLKQNVNIIRNVGENYVEDVQTKALQRFIMLSFSYFLSKARVSK